MAGFYCLRPAASHILFIMLLSLTFLLKGASIGSLAFSFKTGLLNQKVIVDFQDFGLTNEARPQTAGCTVAQFMSAWSTNKFVASKCCSGPCAWWPQLGRPSPRPSSLPSASRPKVPSKGCHPVPDSLATALVSVLQLVATQLPREKHYSFGLRCLMGVLTLALHKFTSEKVPAKP